MLEALWSLWETRCARIGRWKISGSRRRFCERILSSQVTIFPYGITYLAEACAGVVVACFNAPNSASTAFLSSSVFEPEDISDFGPGFF